MTDADTSTPAPADSSSSIVDDTSPSYLFEAAHWTYCLLIGSHGSPSEIARRRFNRRQILGLRYALAPLESLIRLALFIMAIVIAKRPVAPMTFQSGRDGPTTLRTETPPRKSTPINLDDPSTWPARFRLWIVTKTEQAEDTGFTAGRGSRKAATRWTDDQPWLRSSWPLARRAEAILRVFNDPNAAARRAARGLEAGIGPFVFEQTETPLQAKRRRSRSKAFGSPCRLVTERARRRCSELAASFWPPGFFETSPNTS
jgi:hypothetical protein